MSEKHSILNDISLITNIYGDGLLIRDLLLDWFDFLGGKPGEVVVIDCGSETKDQEVYWQLYQEGLIDKLQMIQADHEDNEGGSETGYIQEYTAAAIASKPYIMWFHSDTLPYRKGHDNWVEEAIGYLENDDIFAIGGSYNLPCKHHDAWPGWYFSHKCSLNFALMKRMTFMKAAHEFAGEYIRSGFKGENPADATNQHRYLFEVAMEQYIERHQKYALFKIEDPNWTVFHTNTHGEVLKKVREKYRARKNIKRFMNAGYSDAEPIPAKAVYYGKPPLPLMKRIQIAFGESAIGPYWRQLKQSIGRTPNTEPVLSTQQAEPIPSDQQIEKASTKEQANKELVLK
jgi:hypothetical protein